MAETIQSDQTPVSPLLEIRAGGGLVPLSEHKVWVSMYANGRIVEGSKERTVDPGRIEKLFSFLSASPLCDLDQETFDRELRESGALYRGLRGGSGVYTLIFTCNEKARKLTLNLPKRYTDSVLPAARDFAEIIAMVEDLLKTAKVSPGPAAE